MTDKLLDDRTTLSETPQQIAARVRGILRLLCERTTALKMSIPVRADDDDMVLARAADLLDAMSAALAAVTAERDALRETTTRLNRRATNAEAALRVKVEDFNKRASGRVVRSCVFRLNEQLQAEVDRLQAALHGEIRPALPATGRSVHGTLNVIDTMLDEGRS